MTKLHAARLLSPVDAAQVLKRLRPDLERQCDDLIQNEALRRKWPGDPDLAAAGERLVREIERRV